MKQNILLDKSKALALKNIVLYETLRNDKKEYVLSKQLLRSSTSIGANVREANRAQSKKEFLAKLNISLKETDETMYWLELLQEAGYIDKSTFDNLHSDTEEIIKLLVTIIKSTKNNMNNSKF